MWRSRNDTGALFKCLFVCVCLRTKRESPRYMRMLVCTSEKHTRHNVRALMRWGLCEFVRRRIINHGMLVERGAKKLFFNSIIPARDMNDVAEKHMSACGFLIVVSRGLWRFYFNALDCRSLAIKMMNRPAERHHILKNLTRTSECGLRRNVRVVTIVIELPGEKTSEVILGQKHNDFSSQIPSQHILILSLYNSFLFIGSQLEKSSILFCQQLFFGSWKFNFLHSYAIFVQIRLIHF